LTNVLQFHPEAHGSAGVFICMFLFVNIR
jgi:hypothetical protein